MDCIPGNELTKIIIVLRSDVLQYSSKINTENRDTQLYCDVLLSHLVTAEREPATTLQQNKPTHEEHAALWWLETT